MTGRREFIRKRAQEARGQLLQHRYDDGWVPPPPDPYGIEPEKLVQIWKINFLEPAEIRLQNDLAEYWIPPRYAGYMDPARNTIAVARNLQPEVRQFTIAHELGHYDLHREMGILFRDLPMSGAELEDRHRNPQEQEADLFAAHLLMPEELVRAAFFSYFGTHSFGGVRRDEAIASQLSTPERPVTAADLTQRNKRYFSLLLAASHPWSYASAFMTMPSLCKIFRVSMTAMAIQLETLRLV